MLPPKIDNDLKKSAVSSSRYDFLDILKGIAIFEFIVWHIFENFYNARPFPPEMMRSVFSVTGFFVFSSGFVIGSHYYGKVLDGINGNTIFIRLCVRAFKLLIIVFAAGLAMSILKNHYLSFDLLGNAVLHIVSLLYKDRWDISLQVLVSIAFTLVISYGLMILLVKKRFANLLLPLALVLVAIIDIFYLKKPVPYLWRYCFQGVIGLCTGIFFSNYILKGKFRVHQIYLLSGISLFVFFVIEIFVIVSEKKYLFFLFKLGPQTISILSFFLGCGLLYYLLYDLGTQKRGFLSSVFIIQGRYSLFVYLFQIIVIDLIVILTKGAKVDSQSWCLFFSIGLWLLCAVASYLLGFCRRIRVIDRFYRLVFA